MKANQNFYSLLFKVLLPVWLLWQLGWHLAFHHWIDYQAIDFGLLVSVKLGGELIFFAVAGFLLVRKNHRLSIVTTIVLLCIATFLVYTAVGVIKIMT